MSGPIPTQTPLDFDDIAARKPPPRWLLPVTIVIVLVQGGLYWGLLNGLLFGTASVLGYLPLVFLLLVTLVEFGFAIASLILGRVAHRVVGILAMLAIVSEFAFIAALFIRLVSEPAPFDF